MVRQRRMISQRRLESSALSLLLIVATAAAAGTGCLRDSSDTYPSLSASCRVAEDQKGSFKAPVSRDRAVRLAVDPAFTYEQRAAIQRAVAEWNAFGSASIGHPLFEVALTRLAGTSDPRNSSDCDFNAPGPAIFEIRREENATRWTALQLTDRNPGVTLRCQRGRDLTKQIVLINTLNVSTQQLASVVVHELGHALGLDHSCTTSGASSTFADCTKLSDGHAYRLAVMYPSLRVGAGPNPPIETLELKEELRSNDMERANCLYKP